MHQCTDVHCRVKDNYENITPLSPHTWGGAHQERWYSTVSESYFANIYFSARYTHPAYSNLKRYKNTNAPRVAPIGATPRPFRPRGGCIIACYFKNSITPSNAFVEENTFGKNLRLKDNKSSKFFSLTLYYD